MGGFHLQAMAVPRDLCMLDDAGGASSAIMMDPGAKLWPISESRTANKHVCGEPTKKKRNFALSEWLGDVFSDVLQVFSGWSPKDS